MNSMLKHGKLPKAQQDLKNFNSIWTNFNNDENS